MLDEISGALWPLALYFGLVILMAIAITGGTYLLGQRHRQPLTGQPYESGMKITGSARLRIPVRYFRVAMLFVIFDLEAIFLFAWAIAFRQLGWVGYLEILVFVAVLLAALAYLWRQGALDWSENTQDALWHKEPQAPAPQPPQPQELEELGP